MFDSLSGKLQNAFKNLRGLGKISETNVAEALREVRLALLDADVNFKVARDVIERVKTKSIGREVVQSIQPGQQVIKIIHDELVDLLGSANAGLQLSGNPSCVLMLGLHGSGKTTSSGKLGRLLHKQGRTPLLVAADVYRPAAMDQLDKLGQQLQLPVFVQRDATDVLKIARGALDFARTNNRNTLIFDTAGRLQIDEPLVQELVRLRDLVKPQETLLVLDAATGQEAVNVATHFDQALNITGSILTKLDGDARGGAALSMKAVTGKPIKFAGIGEKLEDFEFFADTGEFDRFPGNGFHAQGRAAASIAVEFGEDGAGNVQGLIEMGGDIDGFLACGRVEDEQGFLGFDQITQPDEFLNERFVDLEAASGVEDECVTVVGFGEVERAAGDFEDVGLAFAGEDGELELLSEFFELVHGRRTIDVGRDEQWSSALFEEEAAEFAAGSGFAGAVEAEHEN